MRFSTDFVCGKLFFYRPYQKVFFNYIGREKFSCQINFKINGVLCSNELKQFEFNFLDVFYASYSKFQTINLSCRNRKFGTTIQWATNAPLFKWGEIMFCWAMSNTLRIMLSHFEQGCGVGAGHSIPNSAILGKNTFSMGNRSGKIGTREVMSQLFFPIPTPVCLKIRLRLRLWNLDFEGI